MKIGCSTWSFHHAFETRELDQLGFAQVAAELGLDGIELLTSTFPSVSPRYTGELQAGLRALSVDISAVSVSNDFGFDDADERKQQCEDVRRWTHVSRDLGVAVIRTFTGNVHEGVDPLEAKRWVYECYERVVPEAERVGVTLAVENHSGLMNSPEELAELVMHFGSDALQLNPDPTNFLPGHWRKPESEREVIYTSLERIARFAVHSHIKLRNFDATGRPTNVDVPRLLKIYRRASYDGYLSIECAGTEDPKEVVRKTLACLRPLVAAE